MNIVNVPGKLQDKIFYILIPLSVAFAIVVYMQISGFYYPKIELLAASDQPETIRIYMDHGEGFSEHNSVVKRVPSGVPALLRFPIENSQKIRIDVGSRADSKVRILGARILSANHSVEENLIRSIQRGELHQSVLMENYDILEFQSLGTDPHILLPDDFSEVTSISGRRLLLNYLLIFGFVFISVYATIMLLREKPKLFLIVLVGILIRGLYFGGADIPVTFDQLHLFYFDESTYFNYIQKLLKIGLVDYFASPESLEAAPGNIMYLSLLMEVFSNSLVLARVFNLVVLGGSLITITYLITERFFGSPSAMVAASLVALYPELIYFGPSLLTEPLFMSAFITFVFLLGLIFQESAITKKGMLYILAGAIAGAIAALTRVVFLPFYAVLLVLALYQYWKKYKFTALKIFVMICISGALILPFLLNGFRHSGEIMISTGSGAALWLGSRPDTDGDQPLNRGQSLDWEPVTKGASHLSLEGDRLLRKAALENIKQYPMNYILLCFKKIGRLVVGNRYFWFRPYSNFTGWYENHTFPQIFAKLLSIFFAVAIAILGFWGALLFARDRMIQPAVLLVLFLIAVYVPFFVSQRYGLPIFLLNAVFAAGLVVNKKFAAYKFFALVIILLIFGYIISGV